MTARVRRFPRCLVFVALPLAAACVPDASPGPTTWEAVLSSGGLLTGTVAAVSTEQRIEAAISIAGAQPDSTYAWQLREGTCAAPGDLVGGRAVYPTLTANDAGTATAETVIAGTLQPDGTYHAALLTGTESAVRLACGALERW